MILTLDNDLAQLVTDLKWMDWTEQFTIAVVLDAKSEGARVVEEEEDFEILNRLKDVRADHWSIGELFTDLLCSVAYGFPMTKPTGSHRYVLDMLEAIRMHVSD